MHEYSIVRALLDRVEEEARARGATGVHRVRVRLGELAGVDPDLLETAYRTFRAGGVCAGASLELRRVAARWVCPGCGGALPAGAVLRCAACDRPARLDGGDEILLEQIEMEVPDVPDMRLR